MMEPSSSLDMSHKSNAAGAEGVGEKLASWQRRKDMARLAVFAAHKVLAVGGSMTSAQAAASTSSLYHNHPTSTPITY
jgi:hypothetical protein